MTNLLSVNVNDHTEKKGGLTYLSWAWAWAEVLRADPDATWEAVEYPNADGTLGPCMWLPDGTAMVKARVTIAGKTKTCQLPVMDNRNNAVKNPDARKISDAIMRCMTKAISMHGLGLYIYAGEDLPQAISPEDEAATQAREKRGAELEELALFMIDAHENGKDMDAIRVWYAADTWTDDKTDEQTYVWGLLKQQSKLRAAIKANKPESVGA